MAHLRVFSPDGPQATERLYPLELDQVVIGRDPGCDLLLQGTGASRRHAIVHRNPAGWMLVDQGSANGTLVQGQRIASHGLQNGDTILMGDSRLVFADVLPPIPGTPVHAPPISAPPAPAPPMPRCSRCGAANAPGNRFCGACGLPLAGPPPVQKKKRGGCLWIAGCGCLLALLLVSGLAAFIVWRAGGLEGLTRRSIHTPRAESR